MGFKRLVILLTCAAGSVGIHSGQAHATTGDAEPQRCSSLALIDFSQLPDAPTQIIKTHAEAAADNAPGYCEVSGYVTPSIGFLLRLPTERWNGKFIELGCGGTCGSTAHVVGCEDPLRRGYACIVSDGGHPSSGGDLKWAYNNPQAVIDYVVRASHVTALAGKAIAAGYYSRSPEKSYFMGCSAGGLQAMTEAQRFPWDFDGIVAGAPDLSVSEDWINLIWASRALIGPESKPVLQQPEFEALHAAVVAKCDLNDGLKDGLIGDPRRCTFDPAELACAARPAEGCLSASQVEAARKIYRGATTAEGEPIGIPHVFRGSELAWSALFGGSAENPTPMSNYLPEWFRYYFIQPNPGPTWQAKDFDFERDYRRFGVAELTEPTNPDLRRFNGRGGKLLLYMGWNDAGAGVGRTIDYYESAEKLIGSRAATQAFFRLFMIPGVGHCAGGEGADTIDYLSYLEAWSEQGHAPDKLIGSHLRSREGTALRFPLTSDQVEFSRPFYPYPLRANYSGRGDTKEASSFAPVER